VLIAFFLLADCLCYVEHDLLCVVGDGDGAVELVCCWIAVLHYCDSRRVWIRQATRFSCLVFVLIGCNSSGCDSGAHSPCICVQTVQDGSCQANKLISFQSTCFRKVGARHCGVAARRKVKDLIGFDIRRKFDVVLNHHRLQNRPIRQIPQTTEIKTGRNAGFAIESVAERPSVCCADIELVPIDQSSPQIRCFEERHVGIIQKIWCWRIPRLFENTTLGLTGHSVVVLKQIAGLVNVQKIARPAIFSF